MFTQIQLTPEGEEFLDRLRAHGKWDSVRQEHMVTVLDVLRKRQPINLFQLTEVLESLGVSTMSTHGHIHNLEEAGLIQWDTPDTEGWNETLLEGSPEDVADTFKSFGNVVMFMEEG